MNTYKYKVTLEVQISAFDESDAWDALQDAFGIGENMGVVVNNCEYKEINRARKN